MAAKFELSMDKKGEFRFKLSAPNGETIAVSEGYSTKANAMNGIAAVKQFAAKAETEDKTAK